MIQKVRPILHLRLSQKVKYVLLGSMLCIIVLINIFYFNIILKPDKAKADTCVGTYELDWGDPSTYTVTCGSVNAANWSVKGMTCFYFSPVIDVGGAVGGPNGLVDISVRINQSGNVDNNDTARVSFYNNGIITHKDVFTGAGSPSVFTSTTTLSVSPGGTFQVSIELMNDKTNELWQVKNGEVTACIRGISPLPVTLTNFKLTNQNNDAVLLNWTTASEIQNDYFIIERSDNRADFSEIARINGAGNSTILRNYSFTDKNPISGTSYYRLKQIDFNGQFEIIKTLPITIAGKNKIIENAIAYPNPFKDQLSISFVTAIVGMIQAEINSMNGVCVHSETFNVSSGSNQYNFIETDKLKEGFYIVRFLYKGEVLYSKKVNHKRS